MKLSTENGPNIEYGRYCPSTYIEGKKYVTLRYCPKEPRWEYLMDMRTDNIEEINENNRNQKP